MKSDNQQFSAVIITFNEEKNIEKCLLSLVDIADEIIVLDSFSTDKTKDICLKFDKVKFFQNEWKGYSESKNIANSFSTYNWILSLDADEVLSEKLKVSLIKLKKSGLEVSKFNRITNYCGHWIRHGGWYPDTKIRLFNKTVSYWRGEIHEDLYIPSNLEIIHLQGDCLHFSYYNVNQHYQQAEKFTTIQAKDLFNKGKKSSIINLLFSSAFKFIKDYFLKLGFLDGHSGFTIARISAYATYLKYKKIMDLQSGKSI